MISIPIARLAPCAVLLLVIGGCAHVGQAPISSAAPPREPMPVALRHVAEIRPGTLLRVFTRDGDSTAGFFLGMTELDPAGISGRAPALKLGVGDSALSARMFESGSVVHSPSSIQLADTVVFAMDLVKKVLVPGEENVPPPRRSGLTIAIGVLVIVGALLGLDALLYHPSSKIQ